MMNHDRKPNMKLQENELQTQLKKLQDWTHSSDDGGSIQRQLMFEDFVQAFGFMAQVALLAEKNNHHPDWSNVWNRVDIRLSTHDVGGISMKDIKLAQAIDALLP